MKRWLSIPLALASLSSWAAADDFLGSKPVVQPTVQSDDVPMDEFIFDEELPHDEVQPVSHTTTQPAATRMVKAATSSAPPPSPYKGLFYDNDFSYLDAPGAQIEFPGDRLKQIPLPADFKLDLGGEYRLRFMNDDNLRGNNLTGRSDTYLLQRTRLFFNLENEMFQFYAEGIDATSDFEQFPATPIDENRFDALNLFGQVKIWEACDGGSLYGRVGRQELLYGEQRLVSPLDWANTRRTFDGAKLFWRGTDWDIDGWYTMPIQQGQHLNHDTEFDAPDQSQEFVGLYSKYKGFAGHQLEGYYLRLAEYDAPGNALFPEDFDANTLGARWQTKNWLLYEVEGGYQFGNVGPRQTDAHFWTVGTGYQWEECTWKPTLWGYFDYASGDKNPGDSTNGTFNQLFPLGHKYMGFTDLVARQNIIDWNARLTMTPHKKVAVLFWYHYLVLAEASDALYNAPGVPIRRDVTGQSGTEVGHAFDFTVAYKFNERSDLLIGWSGFWGGNFVDATNPAGVSGDANLTYVQQTFRF